MQKNIYKKVEIVLFILKSDKLDFRTKKITRNKKEQSVRLKNQSTRKTQQPKVCMHQTMKLQNTQGRF